MRILIGLVSVLLGWPYTVNAEDGACQLSLVHGYTELLIIDETAENAREPIKGGVLSFVWSPMAHVTNQVKSG